MRVAVKRVTEAGVLQEAIGQIKRGGSDFTISLFASKNKIETWTAERTLWMFRREGALLIQRHDGNLLRIYHVASDQPSLSAALGEFVKLTPNHIMVADIVGRLRDVVPIARAYEERGFEIHAQLLRMHRSGIHSATMNAVADVELASIHDVSNLRSFMERWLDPLSEQIQSIAELREAVVSEGVLVVREGDGLSGMLIHETTGQSTVLRYWHVAAHCHGNGIGSRLMHAFLARCATSRRVVLWVLSSNDDAISKYSHYGFSEDGMIDNIMVRQPEQATR